MKRIKVMLGVLAVVLVASAVPATASSGDDDSCFWAWDWYWGWYLVCDGFDDGGFHHDGFDDSDHNGGSGSSGPG